MAWVYLGVAAAFEIVFVLSMKASEGFTNFWPSVVTVLGVGGGIGFLTLALKTLPVSVGYPIWVGAGTLGSVLVGAALFQEALSVAKLASVGAILVGVIGLKLAAPT